MPSHHDVMYISIHFISFHACCGVMCHLLPTVYCRTLANNRSKNENLGDYFFLDKFKSYTVFETPHVVCDHFDPCVTTKYICNKHACFSNLPCESTTNW